MNKDQIKALALASGFKLKPQPDGTMDLNPYVYDFAEALIIESMRQFEDAQAAMVVQDFIKEMPAP